MKKIFFYLIILLSFTICKGQNINSVLNSNKSAKDKFNELIEISSKLARTNYDSSIIYSLIADSIAMNSNDNYLISESKSNLAILYVAKPEKSIAYAFDNLELCERINKCDKQIDAYLLMARVYWFIGNNKKVFLFWNKALEKTKTCKNKESLIKVLTTGSEYHYNTGQFDKSKEIEFKLAEVDPQRKLSSNYYSSIGDVYRALNKLDSADFFYKKAINIAEQSKDTFSIANLYLNYSLIPRSRKEFEIAISYCNMGFQLSKKINSQYLMQFSLEQLKDIYLDKGDYLNAKLLIEDFIKNHNGNKINLMNNYKELAFAMYSLKDYKNAYENLKNYIRISQEINSSDSKNNLSEIQEQQIKKEKQKEIDREIKAREIEEKSKNIFLFSLIICIGLIIFILFIISNLRKSKKIISKQKSEVETQKHIVEEKQKEILDSINYAKRLQEAILPPLDYINEHLPNNFVLYQPKDVVAGDFYWAEMKDDKFFIAAADCTGHGVPGAMVSVVCSNALNRTVNEFGITNTGNILDKTRELVLETFAKGNAEVKDGMDISLLCIDKQNNKAFWSGANNPLWYVYPVTSSTPHSVTSSEVEKSTASGLDYARPDIKEIKADKQPIGKTDNPKPYTTHEIELKPGMQFYLFTDGFADQFGGPKGKKFKYKQLEELLLSISNSTMQIQKETLLSNFSQWKGDLEQVDDVCIVGVKI